MSAKRSAREHKAARRELADLAQWIQDKFRLSARPKIHTSTEAEGIYAEILRRIVQHGEQETERRAAAGMGPEE